jgi:hypothetical protein
MIVSICSSHAAFNYEEARGLHSQSDSSHFGSFRAKLMIFGNRLAAHWIRDLATLSLLHE